MLDPLSSSSNHQPYTRPGVSSARYHTQYTRMSFPFDHNCFHQRSANGSGTAERPQCYKDSESLAFLPTVIKNAQPRPNILPGQAIYEHPLHPYNHKLTRPCTRGP